MISLSDDELRIVMDAAKPLAPRSREAFLIDVAAELAKYPELGAGIVSRVASRLQRQHLNPPRYLNGVHKYGH
jgi:hypothetical protein